MLMEVKDMQEQVDSWVNSYKVGYFHPLNQFLCIAEESGEIARILNDVYGPKKKKPDEVHDSLADEIGDLLFAVICIANVHDISLESAFLKTMKKYRTRDKERYEKKGL